MNTLAVIFVIFALVMIAFAVMSPSAGAGRRVIAGSLGILALLIAAVLGAAGHDEHHDWDS
jgi:hypothetical protein